MLEAESNPLAVYKDGDEVSLCGIITHITVKQTKAGQNMAFITAEDMLGSIEIVVFPKVLAACSSHIVPSGVITVFGTLSIEEEKKTLKILANIVFGAPDSNSRPAKSKRASAYKKTI
ncbi:MAG: OB-fold nucleic acid binding domain-containing protein [Anaerotruncus sp.]|nr:MAG: OB-fold nucleic acid binding domain-containing protein [Anaerotruncus sp.]